MLDKNVFKNSREILASPEEVFAAISNPLRLQKWWGPAGFTNTFHICEFKKGGRWSFIMHGPDGKDYPNENVVLEIDPNKKVVIEHISKPEFVLTMTLSQTAKGTLISWEQDFKDESLALSIEHIIVPANEQNFDRLTVEILGEK